MSCEEFPTIQVLVTLFIVTVAILLIIKVGKGE